MTNTETPRTEKTVDYWLDRAVALEAEGKQRHGELALNKAIKLEAEQKSQPA